MSKKNFPKTLPDFLLSKAHVKVLRQAHSLINDGHQTYVCLALDAVEKAALGTAKERIKVTRAVADLGRFINRALKANAYLNDWQSSKGIYQDSTERRQDRLDWIDYILKKTGRQATLDTFE